MRLRGAHEKIHKLSLDVTMAWSGSVVANITVHYSNSPYLYQFGPRETDPSMWSKVSKSWYFSISKNSMASWDFSISLNEVQSRFEISRFLDILKWSKNSVSISQFLDITNILNFNCVQKFRDFLTSRDSWFLEISRNIEVSSSDLVNSRRFYDNSSLKKP